jgi:hypothetical protein
MNTQTLYNTTRKSYFTSALLTAIFGGFGLMYTHPKTGALLGIAGTLSWPWFFPVDVVVRLGSLAGGLVMVHKHNAELREGFGLSTPVKSA